MEISGFEPLTFAVQKQCSTYWAIFPSWVILDLNQRPYPYQGYALANWANNSLLEMLVQFYIYIFPAAPSGTTTLLRLHHSYHPYFRLFALKIVQLQNMFLNTVGFRGVTGSVYRDRNIFTAVWLTCNYLRFQLYIDELQSTIWSKKIFSD